jgi:quercetin dioxygenase-like cupin family protein
MAGEQQRKTNIPVGLVLALPGLVEYGEGAVVSRTLIASEAGTVTVFAFDAGQGLSEHTAPFDALVEVIEGEGDFVIGGTPARVGRGQIILMPANVPHAVHAENRFKMLLTMLRK